MRPLPRGVRECANGCQLVGGDLEAWRLARVAPFLAALAAGLVAAGCGAMPTGPKPAACTALDSVKVDGRWAVVQWCPAPQKLWRLP